MDVTQNSNGTILIVDDVPDNLELLAEMLADRGHAVTLATSGKQALKSITESAPDLVLLDIAMPGMDGYEVCEHLKANPATANIPVIFLSAHADTQDVLQGFKVGGVDYIGKPFRSREVIARVQTQLSLANQRRQIEKLLERERQQYESLTKMKDQFLHATAHDLKNPLTGVLMYSQILKSLEQDDFDQLPEIAQGIEQTARKMQRLITDILDLAQIEFLQSLTIIPTNLNDLLSRAAADHAMVAAEKSIEVRLNVPENPVRLPIDAHRFERVLDNLVSNAVKYTPDHGNVTIWMEEHTQEVRIGVTDTGSGIPENDIPHLFDAFYRSKSHRNVPGTGLGLSLVKVVIEQHHGTIHVDSTVGQGSTFCIVLPREA